MPASAPSELRLPLAVVAHDAGAANLILGWIATLPPAQLRLCADGPAAALFMSALPACPLIPLEAALNDAAMLLSGTSGPHSSLEHEARQLARARGLPSIGVIDHWVNYRARFIRADGEELPDEIWVTDALALGIARPSFPGSPVHELPNRYLENLVAQTRALTQAHDGETHVLYVLEPMRSNWGRGETPGEFQALDFFLTQLPTLANDSPVQVRLRPHPSDAPGKYDSWLAARRDPRLSLDPSPTLPESIAWADGVAGCESYALVAALAAGRKAFSTLPPWAPACRLPHGDIVKLRDLAS
jgi:hypothetical protein